MRAFRIAVSQTRCTFGLHAGVQRNNFIYFLSWQGTVYFSFITRGAVRPTVTVQRVLHLRRMRLREWFPHLV
jgi:hypothetical protein